LFFSLKSVLSIASFMFVPFDRHTHLPNAINIPPDRVAQLAPEMLPNKSADIVVYCASPT
jgi:rhodanese-related sulfurtransferase